tara:strand:+ start:6084 stop:12788 length:6705 start_codon:yes stop_codon:yes gene_type:complete
MASLADIILGKSEPAKKQEEAVADKLFSNQTPGEYTPTQLDEGLSTAPQTLGGVFAESVRGGSAQLTSDFERFKGLGNLLLGDQEAAQRNLAIAESYDDYSSELLGQIQPFEEFLDEPTFGGFLTQVTKAIGQFTPMAVSSVASGFGGAAAGMLGKGGLRLAGKKGADKLYDDVLKKVGRNEALTPDEKVIFDEGLGYLKWAKRGGITGAFGQEYVVGSSQAASEYQEAGIDLTAAEAAQSFLLGIPQAVLGTASETIFARAMLKNALKKSPLVALERKAQTVGTANLSKNEKKMYDLFQKYKKSGEGSLTESQRAVLRKYSGPKKNPFFSTIRDVGKGFVGSGAVEGVTELGQEGLGVAQRFAIDDEYTSRDAKLRLAEAAFAGFFAGGARGGAGGAVTSIISKTNNLISKGINLSNQSNQDILDATGTIQNTDPKDNNQVQGELNLNKNTILLPGVTPENYKEVYSDIDFGDKDTVLPYKGQGVVLGTKESLQEAANYYSRNTAKETNNQEVTLAEQQQYQQAIIKALDGEDLFDVVDNPTHIITVKNNEGNVVAQKQVSQTVENLDQAVTQLQQKYPNTQVEAFAMEDTKNMIDPNDPDIDDMDALELDDDTTLDDDPDAPVFSNTSELVDAARKEAERTGEDIDTVLSRLGGQGQGGQFGQQLEEARVTIAPELVARTESEGDTNQTYKFSDPLTYKKTNYEPRPETKEGKNKSADEELTRLRQRYLDELGTDQEKTYWGGVEQDVNSPKMKTLSLSLLKAYFEQQPTKPDIAIVTTPSDSGTYSLVTRTNPNIELVAIQSVEKAVLESLFKNKQTGQSQATPGFKIKVTNNNAPTTLGYGDMKFLFANQDVSVNMHTLLFNGLQIFPEINLELNTVRNQLQESGLNPSQAFAQAFAGVAPDILEAYKAQGFEVVVQKDFGKQDSEFVSLDESPLTIYEVPLLYRRSKSEPGAPTQFMSLTGMLEDVDNLTSAKKAAREKFSDYTEILNNLKADPETNLFGEALIERAKAQYAQEGGDMSIFFTTTNPQGIVGKLTEIQKLNKKLNDPKLSEEQVAALEQAIDTYNREINQTLGKDDSRVQQGGRDESVAMRESTARAGDLRVEGPTGVVPEMTTQIFDDNGELIVLPQQPAQEGTLPVTEYEIGQKRDEFTQTQERVQTTPANRDPRFVEAEQQRAERNLERIRAEGTTPATAAPEVDFFEGTPTFNPTGVEVNLNNIEAGVEASPNAATIFDLQEGDRNFTGESLIAEMNKKLKDLFKVTSKTFVVTAEDSVNLTLKNSDGTELKTMNSDGESRTVAEAVRQMQKRMIEQNLPGMAQRFAGGQINVVILNPKALRGTNKTANDIATTYVLGHELGHVIFREEMTRLGLDAFGQRTDKKVNKADERTGQILFKEFKKVEDQYATRGFPFEEWYADRMSQFLLEEGTGTVTTMEPSTPMAPSAFKYFETLAKKIKQLWQSFDKRIRARYGEVNPVFTDYANGVVEAYRNGLTRDNITASVTEQADIKNWVDSTSQMVGKMVGKKNATRFSALAKKILRSEFAKDVRGFFTYILAPADNYLRLVNPELAKALYSRSQTTEATGFFNYHPVVQYRYTNDFYKIFNIEKDPTTADLERIDSVLEGAEQLAALPQDERAAAADTLTVLDKDGNSIQVDGAEALEVLKFFDTFYEDYILKNELDPENPTVKKNMVFFTRQYDIAKLAAEPEAREALARVLQKYNSDDTFEQSLASVEAMVANAESSDAIRLEGAADLSIGMQKDRQKKFINITNNADLRNIEGIGDLIIPAHHAIRKYIAENVKKVEFKNKVSTTLTQGDFANGRNNLEKFDVGERVSGPKAAEVMINRIDSQRDRGRARKAVQAMLGKAGMNMPGWLRTTQSYLLALNVMTYLTFATVASLPDLAGPVLRSKEMSIFGKEFRTQIANYFNNKKEMEQFARDVGVIGFDSISQMYINAGELGYMTEGTKYYTQQFFKYTGLEWYTNFTRIYAAGMGRQFLTKHANDNSVKSKEYLAELGVTAEQIKAAQKSGWDFSDPQHKTVQDAIARFTEESIVRPNAAERPAWASNPYTALIFQLKSFFYAYGKNIIGGVIRNTQSTFNREGKISAAAMPAIFASTALLPLAMIGMELRELLKYFLSPISSAVDFNDRTEAFSFDSSKFRTNDMGYGEWLLEASDRSGVFGAYTMLFPMFEAGRFGDEFYTSLLGPTAQRFEDLVKGDVQTKDFIPGFASVY